LAERRPDGTPRAASTAVRYRAVLRAFLAWCVREGLRRDNPADGVQVATARPNRRDHLTPDEQRAVLRALDAAEVADGVARGWLRDWILFATRTGLRPGEQRDLTWGAVRLAEGTVRVGHGGARVKTAGSARTIPVRGAALDVLRRLAAERRDEDPAAHVFRGPTGGPVPLDRLTKVLRRTAEAAGIPKRLTAYGLRHSAATQLAVDGTPLFVIARLLGTSVGMVEAHYAHAAPDAGASHLERAFADDAQDAAGWAVAVPGVPHPFPTRSPQRGSGWDNMGQANAVFEPVRAFSTDGGGAAFLS
jgi:integrase